jgi:hypothetical protein
LTIFDRVTRIQVFEVTASYRLLNHETLRVSQDFEVSLLRLLEKITNGTLIKISVTGMDITVIIVAPD